MFTGLTTLFANVFCLDANRSLDAKSLATEPCVLIAVMAFLAIWVLCQTCYWTRSRLAVRRCVKRHGSPRLRRRAEKELARAGFQLKVCLPIVALACGFCCFSLFRSYSPNGSLANSEQIAGWIQNVKGSLVVGGTNQSVPRLESSAKVYIPEDEAVAELRQTVENQAKEMNELSEVADNAADAGDAAPVDNSEKDFGVLPGTLVYIPFVNADEVQQENVSNSESNDALLSSPSLSGAPETRNVPAPSRLRASTSNNATTARNLQKEAASGAVRSNVRAVAASQLDAAFFEAREDREAQRRLNEYFTPEKPLAPLPESLFSSRSKYRSVNYEEKIEDGTTEGLVDGVWSTEDLKGAGEDVGKSILVQIDEESNRISSLVRACVLPIETRKSTSGSRVVEEETGCGFLTQYKGKTYVVTNNHVVDRALSSDSIKIFLPNNQTISPSKIFPCDDFDLAALEVSAEQLPKDGSVTLCRFGDSDSVRVANSVFAIGNPFGLEKSLSYGHVSSLRRCNRDLISANQNLLPEYIQIDAAINPGNSGGPLYDSRGDVVGIVTAIATTSGKNEGVAFAIPINVALRVVKTTIDGGVWRRSRLGVELEPAARADLTATRLPYVFGAKIVEISSQSPAQTAGLKPGDVVLSFNGKQVENDVHLARLIALADASEIAKIGVLRGAAYFETGVKLERSAATK